MSPIGARGGGHRKGERRRGALARRRRLLRTGGFEAVRHRAVAEKAGLPLASTTYYFASLDELVTAAVEHRGRAACRGPVERGALRRRRSSTSPSWCSTSCSAPSRGSGLEAVLLRYERLVGSGRRPYLAPLMRAMRAEFDALLAAILARAGHHPDDRALHAARRRSSTAPWSPA